MRCVKCEKELPAGALICCFCGSPTEKEDLTPNNYVCINCRKEFDPSFVYCDRCGYKLITKNDYKAECTKPIIEIRSVKRITGKKRKNRTKTKGRLVLYIDRIEFTPKIKKEKHDPVTGAISITPAPDRYYFSRMKNITMKQHSKHKHSFIFGYSVTGDENNMGEVRFGKRIRQKKADAISMAADKYIINKE